MLIQKIAFWSTTAYAPKYVYLIIKVTVRATTVYAPKYVYFIIKGTVCATSSDPSCKVANAQFTSVPLKA